MRPPLCPLVRRPFALLLSIGFVSAAAACSRGPQFAQVEGTITLNGRPLTDAEVVFLPDPETGTLGPSSSAYTDGKGRYQLATNKGQSGAVVGTHRVCIRDLTTLPVPPILLDGEDAPPRAGPRVAKPTQPKLARVPPPYSNAQETPLRAVEVKPGTQTLDFEVGDGKKK